MKVNLPVTQNEVFLDPARPIPGLADSKTLTAARREALAALELLVVVDVTMTETARLAHYVLPVASQLEKAEATFFNFEFPHNVFHLRRALMPPPEGLFSEAELHARLLEQAGLRTLVLERFDGFDDYRANVRAIAAAVAVGVAGVVGVRGMAGRAAARGATFGP